MTLSKKDLIEKWAQSNFFLELSEKDCKEKAKDIADALLSRLSLEDAFSVSTDDLAGWGPTRDVGYLNSRFVENFADSGPVKIFKSEKGISYIFISKKEVKP